jgi:hypothetical protein
MGLEVRWKVVGLGSSGVGRWVHERRMKAGTNSWLILSWLLVGGQGEAVLDDSTNM